MSTYVFDQAWRREHDRLRALEDLYDPASQRHLAATGVGEGWRCLEVGCGAGSVAEWLAVQVGATGHVVATDLDPRFVARRDNLDVWRHDILGDPLEEGYFDLVHARLVLEHIPERERALARMVAAARPGGWVVAEDLCFGGPAGLVMTSFFQPAEHAEGYARVVAGIEKVFVTAGADPTFGARLPAALAAAGLDEVGAALSAPVMSGGGSRDFPRLTLAHLRDPLVGAGLLSDQEVETMLSLTHEPTTRYLPPLLVTAWGRRP